MLFHEGDFSGVGNGHFLLLGGILSPSTGFLPNGMFGGRVGQSIYRGGSKQDESRGNIFNKMENTGYKFRVIILLDTVLYTNFFL